MNRTTLLQALTDLGERQLEKETEAAGILEHLLKKEGISYSVQAFVTDIPVYTQCTLAVDGELLTVLPSGFVSGTITNNHTLLSSLISSQKNLYDANINFNPLCPSISRSNHYFAPAFSIARTDVQKVVMAETVVGTLEVTKTAHTSKNILIGNTVNPSTIVFCHYDSIATGAVDNASGTVLSLELIIEKRELLQTTLFVLSGNEELSYDEPIYWGHGYRCFEKEYASLLEHASNILVLDSFGHTPSVIFSDQRVLTLAFPIKRIADWANKTVVLSGAIDALMHFYHADNDVVENIVEEYFEDAKKRVLTMLGASVE